MELTKFTYNSQQYKDHLCIIIIIIIIIVIIMIYITYYKNEYYIKTSFTSLFSDGAVVCMIEKEILDISILNKILLF